MKCSRIGNPGGEGTRLFNIRELKQQRRRRLRKRQLKSEVALLHTLLYLFQLVQFVKCWQILLELNSKTPYQSSGKDKESPCLVFTSSTKREIRHFHVVVMQRRAKKCTKRREARAKFGLLFQSKPIAFLPFSFTSPSSLLKLPNQE